MTCTEHPWPRLWLWAFALVAAGLTALAGAAPARADEADWLTRTQVLYDPDSGTAERRLVRVVDVFPARSLDFTWEPGPGSGFGIDPETGAAEGEGRLIWRIRGLPSYDHRSIFAVFEGRLAAGRPQGHGRLTLRSGEVYDGTWVAGQREGEGYLRDAAGNHYQGGFHAGLPHGNGVYTGWDGTRYEGPFRAGLRHGTGRMRLPGGTEFTVTWDRGREVSSDRPDVFADALTGGLLKAQSGDDASRVNLGAVIDQRMSAQQPMAYELRPVDGTLLVYPAVPELVDVWNATALIRGFSFETHFLIKPQIEAMLNLELESTDGAPVAIDRPWLDVSKSLPVLRPMFALEEMIGCTGYRPYFGLINQGWGAVTRATLDFRFVRPGFYETAAEIPAEGTRRFETPIPGFGDTAPVLFEQALAETGADIAALKSLEFYCSKPFDAQACLPELRQQVDFGELAPVLDILGQFATVGIDGELTFFWTDASGQEQSLRQRLYASISLASIRNFGMAEQGDMWTEFSDAPSHILVDLPPNQKDYAYPLNYRGPRDVVQLTVPLKIRSSVNSIHSFRAAVQFRDGSVRTSQPVQLFYMMPRFQLDRSALDSLWPASCDPPM